MTDDNKYDDPTTRSTPPTITITIPPIKSPPPFRTVYSCKWLNDTTPPTQFPSDFSHHRSNQSGDTLPPTPSSLLKPTVMKPLPLQSCMPHPSPPPVCPGMSSDCPNGPTVNILNMYPPAIASDVFFAVQSSKPTE